MFDKVTLHWLCCKTLYLTNLPGTLNSELLARRIINRKLLWAWKGHTKFVSRGRPFSSRKQPLWMKSLSHLLVLCSPRCRFNSYKSHNFLELIILTRCLSLWTGFILKLSLILILDHAGIPYYISSSDYIILLLFSLTIRPSVSHACVDVD